MADGRVKLGFAGDVWLRADDPRFYTDEYQELFSQVRDWVSGCDIACANLECFINDAQDPALRQHWKPKPKHLRAHPNLLVSLRQAGFNLVTLANNHVMDGGQKGLERTLSEVTSHGLKYVGAGRNQEEAEQALYWSERGLLFAFLAAAEWPEDGAHRDRPGVAQMQPHRKLIQRVRKARESADVVVVQLHGDLEFSAAPAPYRVRLSRTLIDSGATMVVQHHPHVLQGVEFYEGGLIAYSLGNFAFPISTSSYQKGQAGVRDGFFLEVYVDSDGMVSDWACRLTHIGDSDRPIAASVQHSRNVLDDLDGRAPMLSDLAKLRRVWFSRCRAEARYHAMMIYYRLRAARFRDALTYAVKIPMGGRNWRWLIGILTIGRF